MTDKSEAPERIWIDSFRDTPEGKILSGGERPLARGGEPYIHADLATRERDEAVAAALEEAAVYIESLQGDGRWLHANPFYIRARIPTAAFEALAARDERVRSGGINAALLSKTVRDAAFDAMWAVAKKHSLEATNRGGARYAITGDVVNELYYAAISAIRKGESHE